MKVHVDLDHSSDSDDDDTPPKIITKRPASNLTINNKFNSATVSNRSSNSTKPATSYSSGITVNFSDSDSDDDKFDKLEHMTNKRQRLDCEIDQDDGWVQMFNLLKEYGEENGHYNVPFHHEVVHSNGKVNLGHWIATQRRSKKSGKLNATREALLQQLVDENKFSWILREEVAENPVKNIMNDSERWDLMYAALLRYGEENGHCNVPHHIGL